MYLTMNGCCSPDGLVLANGVGIHSSISICSSSNESLLESFSGSYWRWKRRYIIMSTPHISTITCPGFSSKVVYITPDRISNGERRQRRKPAYLQSVAPCTAPPQDEVKGG